jgi:Ca2+-binding RTX toxin-like protein
VAALVPLLVVGAVLAGSGFESIAGPPASDAAAPTRCGGETVDLVGTPDEDRLKGDGLKNGILGLGADDHLFGAPNRDGLCGGRGEDVLSGGRGRDKLIGGAGDDVLRGGLAADLLIGGPGEDMCIGGSGPGDDRLRRC